MSRNTRVYKMSNSRIAGTRMTTGHHCITPSARTPTPTHTMNRISAAVPRCLSGHKSCQPSCKITAGKAATETAPSTSEAKRPASRYASRIRLVTVETIFICFNSTCGGAWSSSIALARGGLHSAAFFGGHAFEVQSYAVLHDFPFGAVLMLRNRFEKSFSSGAHREQLARIVPDAARLAFLAQTFRRASPSLLDIFHVHDYVISQKH